MDLALPWYEIPMAVVDLETTGFDSQKDRIIEVGIVTFLKGEVIDSWGSLVNPKRTIDPKASEVTGITDDDVAGAPIFADVADEVVKRLQDVIICAYNVDFDKPFLEMALARCGLDFPEEAPLLDPLVFARKFFAEKRSKKLGKMCEYLEIPLEEAHRAVHDAEATGKVMFALQERFAAELPGRMDVLVELQGQWKQAQDAKSWFKDHSRQSSIAPTKTGLGAAYLYGDELDPMRAIYQNVPGVGKGSVRVDLSVLHKNSFRGRRRSGGRRVKRASR